MSDEKLITINKPALKKKWDANKGKILGTALVVATALAVIERIGINQHNDFLREHDLYDEFYDLDFDIDPYE